MKDETSSQVVSKEIDFGKELGLMHEVIITGRKVGADRTFWKELAAKPQLFSEMVKMVAKTKGRVIHNYYKVTINYSWNFSQMLAKGKYFHTDDFSDFENQEQPDKEVFVLLVNFYLGEITKELMLWSVNQFPQEYSRMWKSCRHATPFELLALGYQYPKLQLEHPIIALGPDDRKEKGLAILTTFDYRKLSAVKRIEDPGPEAEWGNEYYFMLVCE